MALSIEARRRRRCVFDGRITEVDGTTLIVLVAGDVVRLKVGRPGEAPLLDLDSLGTTANGSGCSFANPSRITIDANDLDFRPGIYTMELALYRQSVTDP